MFRRAPPETNYARCFPRIRGDVPVMNWLDEKVSAFSPHTRGCSFAQTTGSPLRSVFPAYAGMFRAAAATLSGQPGFSPHTRGCSHEFGPFAGGDHVFPAYAGMFRRRHRDHTGGGGFPRIRGDVPLSRTASYTALMFSPHTRGCSVFFAGLHQLS